MDVNLKLKKLSSEPVNGVTKRSKNDSADTSAYCTQTSPTSSSKEYVEKKPKSVELSSQEVSTIVKAHKTKKRRLEEDDEDNEFVTARKKQKHKKLKKIETDEDEEEDDFELKKKKKSSSKVKKTQAKQEDDVIDTEKKKKKRVKEEDQLVKKPSKKRAKKESIEVSDSKKEVKSEKVQKTKKEPKAVAAPPVETWKWWEEEPLPEGIKWMKLEHAGPLFPPEYEQLPSHINFYYNGKKLKLSKEAEEVASFYAKMIDHDYTKRDIFNNNFFGDWREIMTKEERATIVDLGKCDFKEMADYYNKLNEQKKAMSKEEKDKIKQQNQLIQEKYGVCTMDGHKQKVGNYRIEPPGLFRGRGDHPKQGKLKKRVSPSEVTINIGRDVPVPEPPYGKWKSVCHDNTVSWLACWIENIGGNYKYVLLNPTAKLKGQKDMEKFNTARNLHKHIGKIRKNYIGDWKVKDMKTRQRAVALYFIDKLALRAGHEKEEGESADTVGCCSLRVEHIKLHPTYEGDDFVVEFDFLGKDSIRYRNFLPIEKQVYKNLKLFMKNKEPGDDLFDRLSTNSLNRYLNDLMDNLTAKVFRTYNASTTLQQQLDELTDKDSTVTEKVLAYNRANRAVAILCNHQRSVPKTFEKTMENLNNKLVEKKKEISTIRQEVRQLKHEGKEKNQKEIEKKKKKIQTLKEQRLKMELNITDKDENKEIALGTSKLNYLDPRITVAWCKKYQVPIEKIYNKAHREKFHWAIDMADEEFHF